MYGFFWWDFFKKELDKGYLILLVLFGIGIIDSCLDGLYFYVPLLLIKIDYILLLLLFVIVVGLIPSISAIVKSITKKPIKVINSED